MPFLALYSERKILAGLGYFSNSDDLDAETATALISIEAELKKQENEEREKINKKGRRRGR